MPTSTEPLCGFRCQLARGTAALELCSRVCLRAQHRLLMPWRPGRTQGQHLAQPCPVCPAQLLVCTSIWPTHCWLTSCPALQFDYGPEVLAAYLKAANFPVLGCNVDASRSPALKGLIKPHAILSKAKIKVGSRAGRAGTQLQHPCRSTVLHAVLKVCCCSCMLHAALQAALQAACCQPPQPLPQHTTLTAGSSTLLQHACMLLLLWLPASARPPLTCPLAPCRLAWWAWSLLTPPSSATPAPT